MKKLFFAALVAVAAVGSATAIPVYDPNTLEQIGDCVSTPNPACDAPGVTYYDNAGDPISSTTLAGTFFDSL